jgi:hypothetical protein
MSIRDACAVSAHDVEAGDIAAVDLVERTVTCVPIIAGRHVPLAIGDG